jgi:hypothetical protein
LNTKYIIRLTGQQKRYSIIIAAYIAIYLTLSRVSLLVLRKEGVNGFFFVPVTQRVMANSISCQIIHFSGVVIFAPLWVLEESLGGNRWIMIPDNNIL